SVLNARLADLRETGIAEHRDEEGYALTPMGRELLDKLMPLTDWAERWEQALGNRE
ncbi:MAG: transcriptional regulator, partial [Parvibaculum sp.]|nr:transcriptional regulator [Parvibaculum sp.]